jgi:hypothetical protein
MKLGGLRTRLIQAIDSSPLNPDKPIRFGLRALLIGMTAAAIGLGGLSYYLLHKAPATPPIDAGDFGNDFTQ